MPLQTCAHIKHKPPHHIPLPIGWGEGGRRPGEGDWYYAALASGAGIGVTAAVFAGRDAALSTIVRAV